MIAFIDGKLVITIDVIEGYEFVGGLQKAISRAIATGKDISPQSIGYLANLLESLAIDDKQAKAIDYANKISN